MTSPPKRSGSAPAGSEVKGATPLRPDKSAAPEIFFCPAERADDSAAGNHDPSLHQCNHSFPFGHCVPEANSLSMPRERTAEF